jgi:hypothetical protein
MEDQDTVQDKVFLLGAFARQEPHTIDTDRKRMHNSTKMPTVRCLCTRNCIPLVQYVPTIDTVLASPETYL